MQLLPSITHSFTTNLPQTRWIAAAGALAVCACVTAQTPTFSIISRNASGLSPNAPGLFPAISPCGRFVAYKSAATDIVSPDGNGPTPDVFLRDRVTGQTIRISETQAGAQAPFGEATLGSVSAFGAWVSFSSRGALTAGDINGLHDVFAKNRLTGQIVRVSVSSSGAEGDGASTGGAMSVQGNSSGQGIIDARHVVFISTSTNLVPNDTNNGRDIFVHDRDLDVDGVQDEAGAISTVRVNVKSDGSQPNGQALGDPSISADGRFVSFWMNTNNLVPNDTNLQDDVFVHDRDTDNDGLFDEPGAISTTRVSVSTAGVEQNEDHTLPLQPIALPVQQISGDGNHIVWATFATNLVTGDTNNVKDVFVHHRVTGVTTRMSISSSGAEADFDCFGPSISGDGRFVTFISQSTTLAPSTSGLAHAFLHDRDTDSDGIYDEPGAIATTVISAVSLTDNTNLLRSGVSLSRDGSAIAFNTSFSPVGGSDGNSFPDIYTNDTPLDTDGDALLDAWETVGIDANTDGILDSLTFMNAADGSAPSPLRKDLYVEVDAMVGRAPTQTTMNQLASAFALAPVLNPDGSTGITLRNQSSVPGTIVLDETNIALTGWTFNPPAIPWPPEFAGTKNSFFGTLAERADSNWVNIRAAKLMVYRYGIYADLLGATSVSGVAEMPGNDFIITLGAWTDGQGGFGGRTSDQSGLFMHELGHNLGLDHGGCDSINYKPNYKSVMNYTWITPPGLPTNNIGYFFSWTLDYSSVVRPTLDESNLSEIAGIGGMPGSFVPIGGQPSVIRRETGPADFNRDGDSTDTAVTVDLSYVIADSNGDGLVNAADTSPGQTLVGYDDWSNLRFALGGSSNYSNGVHGAVLPTGSEMTKEIHDALSVITGDEDCIADLNGDGAVGSADLAVVLGSWGQAGVAADLNGDGAVGSADLALILGSWGACP